MKNHTLKYTLLHVLAFLILALPTAAFADEMATKIIDIPDIQGAPKALVDAFRNIFASEGHLIYNSDEMRQGASAIGIEDENYWENEELLKAVNAKLRHDALIDVKLEKSRRRDKLIIAVFHGFNAEKLAEFELVLKSKGKLQRAERNKILKAVTPLLGEIDPSQYPPLVTVEVKTTPSGASVLRSGVVVGQTPYKTEYPAVEGETEEWVISLEGYHASVQQVELGYDQNINVILELDESLLEPDTSDKTKSGFGRPIFMVEVNGDIGLRSLDSKVTGWSAISYSTAAFPVVGLSTEFYPFALFTSNDYLAGLGILANFGLGFLEDNLQFTPSEDESTSCKKNDDGTYTCSTLYSRFQVGLNYKLLLQKKEGRLNANGMALDFLIGYNWNVMDIEKNPLYIGHAYQGLLVGTKFSTPLGLDALRAQVGFNFIYNIGFGNAQMLGIWGTGVDNSWGLQAKADFAYDIWKGLFARVGYQFSYYTTAYKGEGCMNKECNLPTNSETMDMYHEIMFGLGWAMY